MALDKKALAAAKRYVADTADSLGSLKGAPCTIKSQTETDDSYIITFEWTGTSGTKETSQLTIKKPKDGVAGISITNVNISATNHLICTMSDGSKIDAGEFPTFEPILENDLTSTTVIGSITGGKKYVKGTPLETIIRDILTTYQKPSVVVNINPSTTLYDAATDSLTSITINATTTKGTQNITAITFYVNGVKQNEITSSVAGGGTFSYKHTFSTPQQTTFSVKADVTDGKSTASQTKTITFIGKSYYGLIEPDVDDVTEDMIKSLSSTLKNSKNFVYKDINCNFNKVVYAYPASLGNLVSIQDEVNNFNYTDSFTKKTMDVDGISYNVYVLSEPAGADGVQITFK